MAEKDNKVFSFKDLKKVVNKESSLGSADDVFYNKYEHIHSGNYMLNALLSAKLLGGYPEGKIFSISGEKGTGKTFLTLNGIREYQKQGYAVKFYDSEGAINDDLVKTFGIDTSDEVWDYKLVSTVEDFRGDITITVQQLLDAKRKGMEIPKMLFVLDSAGNLASKKEVDDALAGKDKVDLTRAKILKSVFRIITSKLAEIGATLIMTNHIYKTTDLFAQSISGGGCLSPEELIIMDDGSVCEIQNVKVGDYVKTINGGEEVLNTFEFEKERFLITFEDESQIICSEDHRFMDVNGNWLFVDELKENLELLKTTT